MNKHFRVVYTGKLQSGKKQDEVIENFIRLTKLTREKAEQFILGGTSRNIKKNLDEDTAERYRQAFSGAGLEVNIVNDLPFGQPLELERSEPEPEQEQEHVAEESKEPNLRVLY